MTHKLKNSLTTFLLLVGFSSHTPALKANNETDNQVEHRWALEVSDITKLHINGFFALKNRNGNSRLGIEHNLGILTTYKLLDSWMIQTGLLYTRLSNAFDIMFTKNVELPTSPNMPTSTEGKPGFNVIATSIRHHMLSVPIYLHIYPGDERQFSFFGGIRAIYILSAKSGKSFSSEQLIAQNMVNQTQNSKSLRDKTLEAIKKAFKECWEDDPSTKIKSPGFTYVCEFGLNYKFKSGFILGMNGLGLNLGYDFTKHLIK